MWCRLAVSMLALVACLPATADARRRERAPATGLPAIRFAQPAPEFTFGDAAGTRRLDSLFGRPVVLNFWASWCEPCQSEIGAFATLARTYGDAVALVTVSEDRTPGVAAAYLAAHDVKAIAVDDPDRRIFDLYTVVPIPTTLVLAPDGSVAHVSVGALDWDELHDAIERVRPSGLTPRGAFGSVGGNAGTPQS